MWPLCGKGFNKDADEIDIALHQGFTNDHQEQIFLKQDSIAFEMKFMPKTPSIWCMLNCTKEELRNGVEKMVKVDQHLLLECGCIVDTLNSEPLCVKIPPGSSNGDGICFPNRGDIMSGMLVGDLIFVLQKDQSFRWPRGIIRKFAA